MEASLDFDLNARRLVELTSMENTLEVNPVDVKLTYTEIIVSTTIDDGESFRRSRFLSWKWVEVVMEGDGSFREVYSQPVKRGRRDTEHPVVYMTGCILYQLRTGVVCMRDANDAT